MNILQKLNNIPKSSIFKNVTVNGLRWQQQKFNELPPVKSLWGYVAVAFNRVDADRLKQVGPDRLCAEWVIKNGGAVSSTDSPTRLQKDYNSLPPEQHRFNIKVIDASGSSIMKIGFDHFRGCKHIDTVILHQCKHLEDDGLQGLIHLKDTLKVLQVSGCDNISDDGLMSIGNLTNLEKLKIFEMRYVKNMDNVKQKLSGLLPKCQMDINK